MRTVSNKVWEKKLPPFSGLVLVAILFVTITWLTGNVVIFGTKAAAGAVPKKVQITNISDTSFTVTYQTDEPVLGSVGYGTTEALGNTGLDDRDQISNKATQHRIHHITMQHLTPNSKYVFEISSGGATYKNNTALYDIITAPELPKHTTAQQPLQGQVTLDNGAIPIEGIVQVTTDTSQILTALLKPDGSYEVPLGSIRTSNLASWAQLTPKTEFKITVSDPAKQSTAVLLADQVSPAPLMVLSKNYDFSLDDSRTATEQATGSAAPADLPVPVDTTQVTSPKITTPKADQSFNDLQPMFEGKALPSKEVSITIHSQQTIETTVQSDANGNWEFRPTLPLDPGIHTITIKALDAKGILQSISQSFTVFAQGSQFIEPSISPPVIPTPLLASPSASLPTRIPSPSPTIVAKPTVVSISPVPSVPGSPLGYDPNDLTDPNNPNSPNYKGKKGTDTVPKSGSSAWIIGVVGVLLSTGVGTLLFLLL